MYTFLDVTQEGPGIVIAHPGQNVTLLCTVTVTSASQTTGWLVNNRLYRINSLRSGILTGHSATLDSNNLIVENIMMNDHRNGSEYRCVIVPAQGMNSVADIIDESDPTILYVAGEYCFELLHNYICEVHSIHVYYTLFAYYFHRDAIVYLTIHILILDINNNNIYVYVCTLYISS